MTCTVTLTGNVAVGGACGAFGTGTSPSSKTMGLSFLCPGTIFGAVSSTDCPTTINTATFIELPCSDSIDQFQLVSLKSSALVTIRVGASPATILGVGGTFPTGFGGGEAFSFDVDGVTIAGTFTVAAQSITDVLNELNQAAIGAAFAFLPFSADTTGQVRVTGLLTGVDGAVLVNTANATIGFASAGASAVGGGCDIDVNGLFLVQFDSVNAPSRIQIKGTAQVEVLVAGTAPS